MFNYRLYRAKRIVKNTFGILSSVFQGFQMPMRLEPAKADAVTFMCTLFHNFLKSETSRNHYIRPGTFDTENEELIRGSW